MPIRYCICVILMAVTLHGQGGRGGRGPAPGAPAASGSASQAPPATDCAASGTVVNAVTGEPIVRAMVSMSAAGGSGSATDAKGAWSVTDQTCGFVTPTALHPGFLNGSYGQSGSGPAKRLELVSGSPVHDLKISLMPEGAVAGRVQDENGDPIEGAADQRYAGCRAERQAHHGDRGARRDLRWVGKFPDRHAFPGPIYCLCSIGATHLSGGRR